LYWLAHVSLQTIGIPYRCFEEARAFLDELCRERSAAICSAYANAMNADGINPKEMDLRNLVKGVPLRC